MTDHDALLAAVQAQPRESVPAGALADHYDDLGEPEVAQIVRHSADLASSGYGVTHSTAFAPPHWTLNYAGTPNDHNGAHRYAVRVNKPVDSKGKYEVLLYGKGKDNKYLVWHGGLHAAKQAQTLVEGLLDKGHLPYKVPPKWLAKQVDQRIEQASKSGE